MKKNFEGSLYKKINTIADWVLRVLCINLLVVICSIPIVTIYPAFLAGYKLFNSYLEKKEVPIFRGFFKFFKENFKKKLELGFLLAGAIVLGVINMTIYSSYLELNNDIISIIGYYVMILLVISAVFVTLYTLPIMTIYPNTNTWLMIKFAFFLSGKYIFRTVLAILIILVPFVLLAFPVTIVFFFFAGVSIPILLYAFLFRKVTTFIESLGKEK